MNREEFDNMFDSAFDEAAKNHMIVPSPDASWEKVQAKLRTQRPSRIRKRLPYAIAVALIACVFLLESPTATEAFSPFFHSVKHLQENVVSFIFGEDSNPQREGLTPPPPDALEKEGKVIESGVYVQSHYSTWDDASANLLFTAPEIGYVPEEFSVNDILLFTKENKKAKKAMVIYSSNDKSYTITLEMMEENQTFTSSSDEDAGKYEEVRIHDNPAYLFLTHDGRASLDFMYKNIMVTIAGGLSKTEIMKVGEGIK